MNSSDEEEDNDTSDITTLNERSGGSSGDESSSSCGRSSPDMLLESFGKNDFDDLSSVAKNTTEDSNGGTGSGNRTMLGSQERKQHYRDNNQRISNKMKHRRERHKEQKNANSGEEEEDEEDEDFSSFIKNFTAVAEPVQNGRSLLVGGGNISNNGNDEDLSSIWSDEEEEGTGNNVKDNHYNNNYKTNYNNKSNNSTTNTTTSSNDGRNKAFTWNDNDAALVLQEDVFEDNRYLYRTPNATC